MARFRRSNRRRLERELAQVRQSLELALDWLTDAEITLGLRRDPYPEADDPPEPNPPETP